MVCVLGILETYALSYLVVTALIIWWIIFKKKEKKYMHREAIAQIFTFYFSGSKKSWYIAVAAAFI